MIAMKMAMKMVDFRLTFYFFLYIFSSICWVEGNEIAWIYARYTSKTYQYFQPLRKVSPFELGTWSVTLTMVYITDSPKLTIIVNLEDLEAQWL